MLCVECLGNSSVDYYIGEIYCLFWTRVPAAASCQDRVQKQKESLLLQQRLGPKGKLGFGGNGLQVTRPLTHGLDGLVRKQDPL